jgi:hemin uptake protein HemP
MMQTTSMGVINRRVDKTILTELSTATQNLGTAATMTEALALRAKTVLQINDVPWDNNIFAIISPAAEAYLMQVDSFSSSDYVDTRPMVDAPFAWNDQVKFRNWLGINWVSHPGITGVGTNAEKCYMFHKSAIGHAMDTEGMNVSAGYNEEDDYSYARTSVFEGAQLLQNSGVVVINHDGSAYTAA